MSENQKRRNSKPQKSPEIVRSVFYDVKYSKLTLKEIAVKHKISGGSLISRWIKKYSSDFESMNNLNEPPAADNDLQKALNEANMKIISLETMIDIAEKELNVNIRKKSGAKQ